MPKSLSHASDRAPARERPASGQCVAGNAILCAMTELWQLGALELADVIRKQEASSREVLDALLARIDAGQRRPQRRRRPARRRPRRPPTDADRAVADGGDLGAAPRRADHRQGEHRRRRLGRPPTACRRSSTRVAADRRPGRRADARRRGDPVRPHQPARLRPARAHRLGAARPDPQPVEPGRHRRRLERRRGARPWPAG